LRSFGCAFIFSTSKTLFMEQNPSLFSLHIDPVTKVHLSETARWGRFLAIIGLVFLVLMIVVIIGAFMFMGTQVPETQMFPGFGVAMAIYYVIIAAIWFIPLLYLLRFSGAMRVALNGNDQQALNTSFLNLKSCFKLSVL
jgi:hypothetical protein